MLGLRSALLGGASLLLPTPALTGACHTSSIRWLNCSENVPSSLVTAGVDFSHLPETLHCGQLDVPMDYAKPISHDNMITLGLAMYRPVNPKGVLFVNTGGSDAVAVKAWETALNQTTEYSGLTEYDLMMMDVRGTYSSNPLNVSLETLGAFPLAYPQNESEFSVFKQASATMFQSWIDSSTPAGIIQYVGTKEVVQDYEQIRKALGYDKINFLGMSYGSLRAQRYALTYPERVGHFALDAVVPYGRALFDRAQDQIAAANRAILRADAYCQHNSSCPFHRHGRGIVPRVLQAILEAVEQAGKSCGKNCSDVVPPEAVQQAVFSMFQGQPDFPALLNALESAMNGNFTALLYSPPPTVGSIVALPLECGDITYNTMDYSDFKKSLEAGLAHDDNNIGRTQIWQLQLYCSGWPFSVTPEAHTLNPHQMLLVTADFDVDAPTEWATFASKQAYRSALVVRHGDDHVSFSLVDQPSTTITKEFLRTGELPRPRHESLVSSYLPNMHRPPVSDPYKVPTGVVAGDIDSE